MPVVLESVERRCFYDHAEQAPDRKNAMDLRPSAGVLYEAMKTPPGRKHPLSL